MTQRMTLINSPCYIPELKLETVGSLQEFFPTEQPLSLEVGCGIGDFIAQLAAREPQHNFLAIDIFNRGCLKTCRRVEAAGLDNVRVLRTEARSLLLRHLGEASLQAIYINCPDPWPKKRHRKRRLVNQEFLQIALNRLAEEGRLHFSTDFVDYGIEVGELLSGYPGYLNCQDRPYSHELGDYPVSKYMRRFLDLGQPIYYCHYRRQPGYAAPPPAPPQKGFRLRWAREEA